MKRILFSADGSGGDLIPMVLMAREFQNAGYEVCVCGGFEFAKIPEDFGVPFAPYAHSYNEIYLDGHRTGYLRNIRDGVEHQESLFQGEYDLLSKIMGDFDCLINPVFEIFVPSMAEAFGIPNVKLMTLPVVPSDRYGPPGGLPLISENVWFNRLGWQAAIFFAHHVFGYRPTINRLRQQAGLPPLRDLLGNNAKCDHIMIGIYEEILPACPTWKDTFDYTYIGPCLPSEPVALSDELEAFIAAGDKPIYIGFGSMRHANADELTKKLVDSIRGAGVRAILAQAISSVGRELEDSDDIHVLRDYPIPHHVLFPKLAGAVHHGSWITTCLAAQAGIPQVALPQAVDQYLWGDRIMRAGLGPRSVDMNRLTTKRLTRGIEQLVGRPEYAANARALAERVREIDPVKNALETFERIKPGLKRRPRSIKR